MAIEVSFSDNAGWVLDKAKVFLNSKPVHHNVILTLLHARVESFKPGRYWVATDGKAVVGVVFQSPLNFQALVTPMEPDIVRSVMDAISEAKVRLPGGRWRCHNSSTLCGTVGGATKVSRGSVYGTAHL